MAKDKTEGTPESDGSPYKNDFRDRLLKWISFLNQQNSVYQIFAHDSIVSNYKETFEKLTTRAVSANPKLNFFTVNKVCFIVRMKIKEVKLSLYFFEDDRIEIIYKTDSKQRSMVTRYLRSNFHPDQEHKGWKATWTKVQEIKNLIINVKKPFNKTLVGLFISLL